MTNHTSGAADLPAIQRYKIGYQTHEWGERSSTPSGIRDDDGQWVRYTDHVAALAAGQAVAPVEAAPDEGFFLLLPKRPKPEAPANTVGLTWDAYTGAQMLAYGRECSDATRTTPPARPWPMEEQPDGTVNAVDPADMGTCPAPPAMDDRAPADSVQEAAARWFTVVYRGISAGDEARALCEHPKASAMSWSHAIRDRDAARAEQKEGEKP